MANPHGITEFTAPRFDGPVLMPTPAPKIDPANPYLKAAAQATGGGYPISNGLSVPLDPDRPLQGIVSNQWWMHTRSGLQYFLNPDTIGVPVYEEMLQDETVLAALSYLQLATDTKIGPYSHPNKHISDTVNMWLATLETPWIDVLAEADTDSWAGHSCAEVVGDYDGRYIRPVQVQALHPGTITYDIWNTDQGVPYQRKNNLRAARQWRFGAYQSYLPSAKIVQTSRGSLNKFGNFYGVALTRAMWKHWFAKTKTLDQWGVAVSRHATPHLTLSTKNEYRTITNPITGAEVPILDFMSYMASALAKDGAIIKTDDITADLLAPHIAFGNDFEGFVVDKDRRIYRAANIPSLVGENSNVGSYALGTSHMDLFIEVIDARAKRKAETMVMQFIKPFLLLNWGGKNGALPNGTAGQFLIQEFKQQDKKTFMAALKDGVDLGGIKPGIADDLNAIRFAMAETLDIDLRPLSQEEIDAQPEVQPVPTGKNPIIGEKPTAEQDVDVPTTPDSKKSASASAGRASYVSETLFPSRDRAERREQNRQLYVADRVRRFPDFKALAIRSLEIREQL